MTTDHVSPTAHPTTLDPSAGHITIINTYVVAPEHADALLDLLARATRETIRHVPGFISANLHMKLDRTEVVNYAQWRNREAIAAAQANPDVQARIREVRGVRQLRRLWGAAPGRTPTRSPAGAAARWASGDTRPPNSHPSCADPARVCAGHRPANPNHGRGPRAHLLAAAPAGSRWRVTIGPNSPSYELI